MNLVGISLKSRSYTRPASSCYKMKNQFNTHFSCQYTLFCLIHTIVKNFKHSGLKQDIWVQISIVLCFNCLICFGEKRGDNRQAIWIHSNHLQEIFSITWNHQQQLLMYSERNHGVEELLWREGNENWNAHNTKHSYLEIESFYAFSCQLDHLL